MGFPRRLSSEQQERLLAGAPFADGGELDEIATFMRAVPAAVAVEPDEVLTAALIPRLAEEARISALEGGGARAGRRFLPRRALVARVAVGAGLLVGCMAGLAFAGVTLPDAARQAFEDVGITLPNQPSDEPTSSEQQSEGDHGASATAPNGKRGAPGQSRRHHGRAVGHGAAHGNGNSGSNSVGHGGTPPAHSGNGASHSNSVGSSGTPPGVAKKPIIIPTPHGRASGLTK